MDEAISALDPTTRSDMQRLVWSLWVETRTSMLVVTQNLAEALAQPPGSPPRDELDRMMKLIEDAALRGPDGRGNGRVRRLGAWLTESISDGFDLRIQVK